MLVFDETELKQLNHFYRVVTELHDGHMVDGGVDRGVGEWCAFGVSWFFLVGLKTTPDFLVWGGLNDLIIFKMSND